MPKITGIKPDAKNKKRINVFIDGEYGFSAVAENLNNCGLGSGCEISGQDIKRILDSEISVAFSKAVGLVCRAPKTRKEIEDFLFSKGFMRTVVEATIKKMEEYRYVDDGEFAKMYIDFYGDKKGRRRLQNDLKKKGVSGEIIEEADSHIPDQKETGLIAAKKFMKSRENNKDNIVKLYRHLAMKGFDFSVCNEIVKEISEVETEFVADFDHSGEL